MYVHSRLRLWQLGFIVLSIVSLTTLLFHPMPAAAVSRITTLVNQAAIDGSGTSVSTSFNAQGSSLGFNNTVVVICSTQVNTTLSVSAPTGFSTAISQSGTPSQAIFYRTAPTGTTTFTCSFGASATNSIQVYEYTFVGPMTGILTSSSTGSSGTSYYSGAITTAENDSLLISSYTVNTSSTLSSWSNSFTALNSGSVGGKPAIRMSYGGAYKIVASPGTYSTTASGSSGDLWRGQIVAFKSDSTIFSMDIVDAGGVPIVSPTVSFSSLASSFSCQTSTATLGTSSQRIRVINNTAAPSWSLGIAATSGPASLWNSAGQTYKFNDPSGSGCTTGQLTINASSGTYTGPFISLGTNSSFNSGVVDSITVASASSGACIEACTWDITNIPLSQKIPAEQKPGSYTLNMTITLVAT